MSQDTELFDLCKEVYKRTRWGKLGDKNTDFRFSMNDQERIVPRHQIGDGTVYLNSTPLYTSDYLLEKLPKEVAKKGIHWYLTISSRSTTDTWMADYEYDEYDDRYYFFDTNSADTPLKALLKLVIALDDAGELKA